MFDFIKPLYGETPNVGMFLYKFTIVTNLFRILLLIVIAFTLFSFISGFFPGITPTYNSYEDFSVLFHVEKSGSSNESIHVDTNGKAEYAYYRPTGVLIFQSGNAMLLLIKYSKILFFLGLAYSVFHQLHNLARSLKEKIHFSKALSKSAGTIGRLFFYSFVIVFFYHNLDVENYIRKDFFQNLFTIPGASVSVYQDYSGIPWVVLPIALFVVALIFITFSLIISYGIKLQQENDLTV